MKLAWLKNAYDWYTEWLWEEFGFATGWYTHLPELYIYHTTGGVGLNNAAQAFLDRVRRITPTILISLSKRLKRTRFSWDISVANAEMSANQGGRDESKGPQGEVRQQ
jgi:hypothetical protein